MTFPPSASDRLLSVYLTLAQYPILAARIRELMRQEMYGRNILDPQQFMTEATQKAVQSQEREGLHHPLFEEAAETWENRKGLVVDQLTDFYFASNLNFDLLNELILAVLTERGVDSEKVLYEFNPETAPLELLFNQGMMIEKMSTTQRAPYKARLREIKVVLIRNMISDQLRYINIARDWFTISDLAEIRRHKLGHGRIGGKAAGMILASRILKEKADPKLKSSLNTPVSFYLGSDLFYTFLSVNNLLHWNDQKYKDEEQMRLDYPLIVEDFIKGDFTPFVLQYMETILSAAGNRPLIVRSSSLLEDSFGTAFAGKYDSIFVPNQGKPEDNLCALKEAITRIYASTLNPGALLYRRSRGLIDYDERMALLIQVVEGQKFGHYYFPQLAGVAFSHNQYRWSKQIRPEDGFVRLVWGLGTRAVDRVGNDYPRLIALSHPTLRPSSSAKAIKRYSQQYVDLINLEEDSFETLPVRQVLTADYPGLRYIAQIDREGFFSSIHSKIVDAEPDQLILTFDDLMLRTSFAQQMQALLQLLENEYRSAVDVEFTAEVIDKGNQPQLLFTLIQCRPLSYFKDDKQNQIPSGIAEEDKIFSSNILVAGGRVEDINYVVYVPPEQYHSLHTPAERYQLERAVGKLNAALDGESFICVGPGRWGTSNPDLGVHVDYADIYNTKALVELSGTDIGIEPEPSLGTHFFQDLLEGEIFPLSTHIGKDIFSREFFDNTPNHIGEWLRNERIEGLKLIRVGDYKPNYHIELIMDGDSGHALAFLAPNKQGVNEYNQ